MQITDGTGWPAVFPYDVIVNRTSATLRERITVGGATGTVPMTLNTLTRGIDGTSAQAHSLGESVEVAVAGSYLDELGQLLGGAAGDLFYYDGTALQKLAKGTAEQMLKQGASAPGWSWQALPKFASTGARTAAIIVPADGDVSYLNAGDATEGPEFYNGTNWRKPWNLPWGSAVAPGTATANTAGFTTTETDLGLAVTVTPISNRRYRIVFTGHLQGTVANDSVAVRLTNQANTLIYERDISINVAGLPQAFSITESYNTIGPTGFKVRAARIAGTGTITGIFSAGAPGWLFVEDTGPSGAPT
jgi:hypothetical protein